MPSSDNNNDFRMKTAEFRGYTVKALEDIERDIKTLFKKVDDVDKKVSNLRIKVATIGGMTGLVVSLITSLVLHNF